MEIQIDPHTLERAEERGVSEVEIREVIETGTAVPARYGRKARAKVYEFRSEWSGRYYEQKRVEVIYAEDGSQVITVTVYVYYGKWE